MSANEQVNESMEDDYEGFDAEPHARSLRENGYTVVALPRAVGKRLASQVHRDMMYYPEYKRGEQQYDETDSESDDVVMVDPDTDNCSRRIERYVMGAFGALGNPSSFHSEGVRELRAQVDAPARAIFRAMYADDPHCEELVCEQLFDRVVQRQPRDKLSAENWHRDSPPAKLIQIPKKIGGVDIDDGCDEFYDSSELKIRNREWVPTYNRKGMKTVPVSHSTNAGTIYGGWVNLSDDGVNQYFVCVRGTHTDSTDSEGFGLLSKEEVAAIDRTRVTSVPVPPGHWLIFAQNIVHQVRGYTVQYPELRVHTAFNVVRGGGALFRDQYKMRVINNKETPLLPSGQIPPMYSPNHIACCPERLSRWARSHLRSCFLYRYTFSPKCKRAGITMTIPYRFIIRSKLLDHYARCRYSYHDVVIMMPSLLFAPTSS